MDVEQFKKAHDEMEIKTQQFRAEIDNLIREINELKREPRASVILIEAHIGATCDQILSNRFGADVFDHIDLHGKRKILERLGIITKQLSNDIEKIQEIRNICAHRRNIKDPNILKTITEKLKSTHSFKSLQSKLPNPEASTSTHLLGFDLYMFVGSRILEELSGDYHIMLLHELNQIQTK